MKTLVLSGLAAAALVASLVSYRVARERRGAEAAVLLAGYSAIAVRHPEVVGDEELRFLRELAGTPAHGNGLQRLRRDFERAGDRLRVPVRGGPPGGRPLATYSPNGFRDLYDRLRTPHAVIPAIAPEITGVAQADARLRSLAEGRGYRRRAVAAEEHLVQDGSHRLQEPVWEAWAALRAAAREDGITLDIVSAYRNVDRQRGIFLARLEEEGMLARGRPFTPEEMAAGAADRVVDRILATSSIPGYSKHHSGYTIDITDSGSGLAFTDFGRTDGYQWISAYNYYNAKLFGFIPSYPEGAEMIGPDPEPWELNWVGAEVLEAAPRL